MKPRYVIPAVVLLLLVPVALLLYGHADPPTTLTDAQALTARTLPGELAELSHPANPDVDAVAYYSRAISEYTSHSNLLPRTQAYDQMVDQIVDLLLKAADAGRIEDGFVDSELPMSLKTEPAFGDALEQIHEMTIQRSAYLYHHDDPEGARKLALAVWSLGRRLFQYNSRLYVRVMGLDMMESAGGMLFELAASDPTLEPETMRDWADALNSIRQAWQPKLELMRGVDPHPGDLVNIALHDQDLMFRIEATLRCGLHRHGVSRGNRRAMQGAIDAAIASDEPMLNEAGRVADAFTLQDRRRFY